MYKLLLIPALSLLLAACGGQGTDTEASIQPAAESTQPAAEPVVESAGVVESEDGQLADAAQPETDAAPPVDGNDAAEAPADEATSEVAVDAAPEAESASAPTEPPVAAPAETGKWIEGKHYFRIQPQQPRLSTSDKVQVVEVFSYGCPACNHAHPFMQRIAKSLPAYAEMDYLPVSFRPDENFPLYQRAYYAAEALGVADEAHDAMFKAVWTTGELGTYNPSTGRPKPAAEWPGLEDIGKFYAQFGVDPAQFVAVANSFAVNTKIKRADQLIKNWMVDSTPSIVIDGKYRYTGNSAGSFENMLELTQYLVQKERHAQQTGS